MWCCCLPVTLNEDALRALANVLDEDQDGYLTKDEVLDLLRLWGTPVSSYVLDKHWPNVDKDKDDYVDLPQLKKLFKVLVQNHAIQL